MSTQLFEQIVQGKNVPLTEAELAQFEIYCSAQSLSLEKLNEISLLLFEQNKNHCLHFLQYIEKNEVNKPIYNDIVHQDHKVRIFNNLFALLMTKATKEQSKTEADKCISEAKMYLGLSENVKRIKNVSSRAFLQYYDGEFAKATNMFNKSLESTQTPIISANENKITGMLGLAQIYFLKRNYVKALQMYKKTLSTFKSLPIKARIGMAYSFFYLEKYQMARACFERVLKLDPNCIQAFVGLGIIQEKNQNFAEYFKYLTKAAKINRNNPLVLCHLSEHFLIKGDLERSTKFAEQGLIQVQKMSKFLIKGNKPAEEAQSFRNDYLELKARFNNLLGQAQHIRNNFLEALKYYKLASGQGLSFNQISLTQVYMHPICQNYVQGMNILFKLFKESPPQSQRFLHESLKDLAYLKSKNNTVTMNDDKSCEQYYNDAIAYNKNDTDVKIELSNNLMETKKARCLKLLLSVYKILTIQGQQSIKTQLLNNIGVLHLQNHEYKEAHHFLELCVNRLKPLHQKALSYISKSESNQNGHQQNGTNDAQEHNMKISSNYLIALFNLGIAKQKLALQTQAIQIYQEIIKGNKFFIDAHIRLAFVYFEKGMISSAIHILDEGISLANDPQAKFIRFDKVFCAKASILKQSGDQVASRQLIKQLNKTSRDIYTQIFQLSLLYEHTLRRYPQTSALKDFLRPNREVYMRLCHDDPNNAFGYLVLCVLLLTDKRLTLKQGSQLFAQLKQHSSEEIPTILYNMGLFFLNYDDYEKAKFIFKLYIQKTNDERGEEMFGLSNLLQNKYEPLIASTKKSILLNPTNIKARYQLFYVSQKKCEQERNDDKAKLKAHISTHLQILKKCYKFYQYFSKANINDYVKYFEAPDLKQAVRNYGQKIRTICEERKFYVSSNLDYYEKLQKDELQKQKEEEERNKKLGLNQNGNRPRNGSQNYVGLEGNGEVADESDSEEIRIRKREEKRKRALELARKKDQEINEKLEVFKEAQKEEMQKKMARAANRQPRQVRQKGTTRKRQKKAKANQSDEQIQYESEKSFEQNDRSSPSEASLERQEDDIDAPKRKRRQQRRQERREKKKKIKKEHAPKLSDNEEFSQNPFDSPQQRSIQSQRQEDESENDRRKKKKEQKKKDEDEDEDLVDMDKFLL